MRNLFLLLLAMTFTACGDSSGEEQPDTSEPTQESDEERAAREAEEEAVRLEREMAEAAAAELKEKKAELCKTLSAVICKDINLCHPEMSEESLQVCQGKYGAYCERRIPDSWDEDAAAACVESAKLFTCEQSSEAFFAENCGGVLADGQAQVDEACSYDVSCAEGLRCEKLDPLEYSCEGFCVEGEKEEHSGVSSCEPGQVMSDGLCTLQSIPGEECGEAGCVGESYCLSDSNTCSAGGWNLGGSCSDHSHCTGTLRCREKYEGGAECVMGVQTCNASHPLMFY